MGESTPVRDAAKIPLRAGFIALSLILFVFGAYEVIERIWLVGADDSLIRFLHTVRGVFTALVVGSLVGWYILRSSPSMFPAEHALETDTTGSASLRATRLAHFGYWFVQMRWLVCLVALFLVFVTIWVTEYLTPKVFLPLLGLVACLAASNLFYANCLRRGRFLSHLLELQIASDLILLTAMLHFSGGIENPLTFLYLFHIIISGILLTRKQCYLIVIAVMLLFGGMAAVELGEFVGHYALMTTPHGGEKGGILFHLAHQPVYVINTIILQTIFMLFTAHFTTTIMGRLRSEESGAVAERQRLERVVESTGAGLAILGVDLRPIWLNDRLAAWLSLPPSENVIPFLPDTWTGGDDGAAAHTLKDGQIRIVERRLSVNGDGARYFQVTIAPLLDDKQQIFQVVELAQDITQQKAVESETMHAAKMAGLGVMAAGIAHEIGNPLASLTTRLRLMEDSLDTGYLKESIPTIREQLHRIDRIVRGVSQFARKTEMRWAACDINAVVNETAEMLRLHQAANQSTIKMVLSKNLPPTMGVRDQLFQVFLNLGINALQAMPSGGEMKVITGSNDEFILIGFMDHGEGMSEQTRQRVFQPFYTTKPSGLGLGLSVVQNIVNAHGGHIKVATSKEKETQFIVFLPVRIGDGRPDVIAEAKES